MKNYESSKGPKSNNTFESPLDKVETMLQYDKSISNAPAEKLLIKQYISNPGKKRRNILYNF